MPINSTPSCDHFGHHGEWKKCLATKILAKVANWRPTDSNGKFDRFEGVLHTIGNVTRSQQLCHVEINRFCY